MGSREERVLRDMVKNLKKGDLDPLTPLLDSYLLERERSDNRLVEYRVPLIDRPRPPGRFSPSKICGCERQAAFAFVGMPGKKVVEPEQELVFDDGKWRHHRWQATFLDMERVIGNLRKFQVLSIEEYVEIPELFVAGSLDVLLKVYGKKWVLDIKGSNSWAFERVSRSMEPIEAHALQLLCYMKARRVPRGMILYEHKDKNRPEIFSIQFSPKRWAYVEEWCERVIKKIKQEDLPPMSIECQSGNFLYERCPFASHCYSEPNIEKVRRRMYRNFEDIETTWEEGRAEILKHLDEVQ